MNVLELRRFLENFADDVPIVIQVNPQSKEYIPASIHSKYLHKGKGVWKAPFNEKNTEKVVVIE